MKVRSHEITSAGEISDYTIDTKTEAETGKPREEIEQVTRDKPSPKSEEIREVIEKGIAEYGTGRPYRITIRARIAGD